jgi:hypothetical protein
LRVGEEKVVLPAVPPAEHVRRRGPVIPDLRFLKKRIDLRGAQQNGRFASSSFWPSVAPSTG